ncbi:MAG: VanZ family protein [Flavobacteriaceae bacterium]|nr:VanZ family protein [Flavobacteriaceae bacterium]
MKKFYKIAILPYIFILIYLMFFGYGRFQMDDYGLKISPILSTVQFFQRNAERGNWMNIFVNVFGNIVMFVPFGFMGWIFLKFQNFKPLLISFLSFLLIVESLQYFTRLGFFDVDDVLLNTLGLWIGFRIWKFFNLKTR